VIQPILSRTAKNFPARFKDISRYVDTFIRYFRTFFKFKDQGKGQRHRVRQTQIQEAKCCYREPTTPLLVSWKPREVEISN